MITGENVETIHKYNKAKETRLRQEKELVHRDLHPLFHKTEDELRNYDTKMSKEAEEQKKKYKASAGLSTPGETD